MHGWRCQSDRLRRWRWSTGFVAKCSLMGWGQQLPWSLWSRRWLGHELGLGLQRVKTPGKPQGENRKRCSCKDELHLDTKGVNEGQQRINSLGTGRNSVCNYNWEKYLWKTKEGWAMGLSRGWFIALIKRRWWIQQSSNTTETWECRSKRGSSAQWRPSSVTGISGEQGHWFMVKDAGIRKWAAMGLNGSPAQVQQRGPARSQKGR